MFRGVGGNTVNTRMGAKCRSDLTELLTKHAFHDAICGWGVGGGGGGGGGGGIINAFFFTEAASSNVTLLVCSAVSL